jgi:hypothetical protein
MEVNLFLEQSLIVVVKQLSRQSVRIAIKQLSRQSVRIGIKHLSRESVRIGIKHLSRQSVRIGIKHLSRQSGRIGIEQLSRQSVRIGLKRFGGSNNRECSAVDQCDRDLFTENPYLREQIATSVNDLESCVPTLNGRWYDYIGNDMHRPSRNQRVQSCSV